MIIAEVKEVDEVDGDILSAIMLHQIRFWMKKGNTISICNENWIAKKQTDWWYEIRFSKMQVRRALKVLKEKKKIETMVKKIGKTTITLIRLQNENDCNATCKICGGVGMYSFKRPDGSETKKYNCTHDGASHEHIKTITEKYGYQKVV